MSLKVEIGAKYERRSLGKGEDKVERFETVCTRPGEMRLVPQDVAGGGDKALTAWCAEQTAAFEAELAKAKADKSGKPAKDPAAASGGKE